MPCNQDDTILIQRCLSGDDTAFDLLIDRYKRQVYSLIYRLVRHPTDAEDLAHDTFIKAYRALSTYDPRYPFITWLFRIAHNTTIDHLRANKAHLLAIDDEDNLLEVECLDERLMATADRLSDKSLIEKALASLPPNYREVLYLRHQQELSYEEISQTLNIPEGTVKIRLFRARNMMKERLRALGYDDHK